jgi:hypothetical protein
MLTKIERSADQPRVETGPVQFGADWPGLFIRGDNAIGLALQIALAQRAGFLPSEGAGAKLLARVAEHLNSCSVRVLSYG